MPIGVDGGGSGGGSEGLPLYTAFAHLFSDKRWQRSNTAFWCMEEAIFKFVELPRGFLAEVKLQELLFVGRLNFKLKNLLQHLTPQRLSI
jgi:hypothetical protein